MHPAGWPCMPSLCVDYDLCGLHLILFASIENIDGNAAVKWTNLRSIRTSLIVTVDVVIVCRIIDDRVAHSTIEKTASSDH